MTKIVNQIALFRTNLLIKGDLLSNNHVSTKVLVEK